MDGKAKVPGEGSAGVSAARARGGGSTPAALPSSLTFSVLQPRSSTHWRPAAAKCDPVRKWTRPAAWPIGCRRGKVLLGGEGGGVAYLAPIRQLAPRIHLCRGLKGSPWF